MTDRFQEWNHPNSIAFLSDLRTEVSQMYPSERVFLPKVLLPGTRVLDVGCALGGFFNIMRSLQPEIDYTGVDIASRSVEQARLRYPEARFEVASALELPFEDRSFDVVHCTGVTVHVPEYQGVISEAYRVARHQVIMDMRLLEGAAPNSNIEESGVRISTPDNEVGEWTHYVVVDPTDAVTFMLGLQPRPRRLAATGYYHEVNPTANTAFREVCMAIFLIEKGDGSTNDTDVDVSDLPVKVRLPN